MIEHSRRALLAGGALALASVAAGAAVFTPRASRATAEPTAKPVTPSPEPVPVTRFGAPAQIACLVPRTSGAVMQQVEHTSTDEFFMTQSLLGSLPGLYTTVVSRSVGVSVSSTSNPELDAMTILDGGHGIGLHVDPREGGGYDVWMSLQGPFQQGDPDGGRLARFAYTPGTYTIDLIPGGVTYLPRFPNPYGELQEAVYSFDAAGGVALERMYDFRTGRFEHYTRRTISDIVSGVDRPIGRMTVPVNTPTMQGFATVDGSLFRWVGVSNGGTGVPVATDPMAVEQFDWRTGSRVAITPFPTLGQDGTGAWRGGAYEPEGCSVLRKPDGTVSLLVGVTVGAFGDRAWPLYELAPAAA
jgi:hypothetical protein